MVVDHQSQINELEFRLEHQESQHMNEMSELEAKLQEQLNELKKKRKESVSKAILSVFYVSLPSSGQHLPHYICPPCQWDVGQRCKNEEVNEEKKGA